MKRTEKLQRILICTKIIEARKVFDLVENTFYDSILFDVYLKSVISNILLLCLPHEHVRSLFCYIDVSLSE